jgi:OmcA/MtrC family decaheme c-type cytochrome
VAAYGADPLLYPEDSNNLKDMIHGIHASGFRTREYEFVRNRSNGIPYNWSEVTFPRGASTSSCLTCHKPDTYELPLPANVLPSIVRTTGVSDGQDLDRAAVTAARDAVPDTTNWVNSPTASACFYCHTDVDAWAHMTQNGGLLSVPDAGLWANRSSFGTTFESCAVCHGPGKTADLSAVHDR